MGKLNFEEKKKKWKNQKLIIKVRLNLQRLMWSVAPEEVLEILRRDVVEFVLGVLETYWKKSC